MCSSRPCRPSRRPRSAGARRALAGAVALVAGAVLAGCAGGGGARDGGSAPQLTAPTSASPLWPDYTPPVPAETVAPSPDRKPYLPVEGVTVPKDGGLRKVSVRRLLERDPNLPEMVSKAAGGQCPGSHCSLRKPVYRDLTGDGREELVVAVDEEGFKLTMLQVYRAFGDTVRPVLVSWGALGLTGETYGRDLVLTEPGRDGQITTRYRWNGERMALVSPGGAASGDSPTPVGPAPRTLP